MNPHIAVFGMLILIVCMGMWRKYIEQQSCRYCGRWLTHESHCPYRALED